MLMAWGQKVSPQFCKAVLGICDRFHWQREQSNHLMASMAWETGESFSPSVRNGAGSGATGLIQFMPATISPWGLTTDQIARMSAEDQLVLVEKYFKPYAPKIHTISDMYMAILLPKYIGAPDDTVLFRSGTIAYQQNKGFDGNSDGVVTKLEATSKVILKLNKGLGAQYAREV